MYPSLSPHNNVHTVLTVVKTTFNRKHRTGWCMLGLVEQRGGYYLIFFFNMLNLTPQKYFWTNAISEIDFFCQSTLTLHDIIPPFTPAHTLTCRRYRPHLDCQTIRIHSGTASGSNMGFAQGHVEMDYRRGALKHRFALTMRHSCKNMAGLFSALALNLVIKHERSGA